jgi:nicotinamide-nucleotide amidase
MLPGVPREMRGMLADTLLPLLHERLQQTSNTSEPTVIRSVTLRTTGIAESLLADRIDSMDAPLADVSLAYLPSEDGVDLRLTTRDKPARAADEVLARESARLRERLGISIYGEDRTDLAAAVLELCRSRRLTCAVAESCSGGLLGARLTSIPGSSDVVLGGVIAYADAVKRSLLDVTEADLAAHGAVSEPVVLQMAAGVRARVGASIGIGITGIAGPGGGSEEKPVGTVWIAAHLPTARRAVLLKLWGDREEIRRRSAQAALDLVRRMLLEPA